MYKYRAIVTEVVDEETMAVAIDLGFGVVVNQKVKMAGIDSIELKDKRNKEKTDKFLAHVKENLLNKEVSIKSLKAEKSGRYLAFFYLEGQQKSYNDTLVELGLVKGYVKKPTGETK